MSRDAFLVAVGIMMSCAWIGPAQALGSVESGAPGGERIFFQEIPSVHGASKYEQKVSEAPASVTIVTADDIRRFGWRTLADALRSVRSLYTTYDRIWTYLGVRGFGRPEDFNTRVLLLVDGFRINNNSYDMAYIGNGFILDIDMVDRIEVIRGPGSSLYGTNAFFAVINVITKNGRQLKGSEFSASAASFDTYKGRLSYGNRTEGGLEVLLSASYSDSRGQRLYFSEYDDPATNNGVSERGDYERVGNLLAKVSLRGLSLSAGAVSREKGIPTGFYDTVFGDRRTRVHDPSQAFVNAAWDHEIDARSKITLRAGYNSYTYRADYQYPAYLNKDEGFGRWWTSEALYTRRIGTDHKLVAGVEYQRNARQDQKSVNDYGDHTSVVVSDRRRSSRWAVYLQDEYRLREGLLLNAGIRYDWYQAFGGTTNPRLALIYGGVDHTAVKFLYGKAFRAPNVYELYWDNGGISQKASPGLDPETIQTYELVLERPLGRDLRAAVSLYRYQVRNLIDLTLDPADGMQFYRNVGKVDAQGVELEVDGRWASWLEGRGSYAYQHSENAVTGETLTNSPRHLLKVNLSTPVMSDRILAGIEVQSMSRRLTVAGSNAGGATVANLTLLGRRWARGLEVSASVYNLFDRKYSDPVSDSHVQDAIPQDGRSWRVKASYEF